MSTRRKSDKLTALLSETRQDASRTRNLDLADLPGIHNSRISNSAEHAISTLACYAALTDIEFFCMIDDVYRMVNTSLIQSRRTPVVTESSTLYIFGETYQISNNA